MGICVYQFLDRSAADLAPADQFILTAMRQWVATVRAGRCPCSALGPVLRGQGLGDMLPDLNMAMLLLDREGSTHFRFQAPFNMQLDDDEALLLSLHALARAGAHSRVQAIVETVVKPEARQPLLVALGRIATAMAGRSES